MLCQRLKHFLNKHRDFNKVTDHVNNSKGLLRNSFNDRPADSGHERINAKYVDKEETQEGLGNQEISYKRKRKRRRTSRQYITEYAWLVTKNQKMDI